MLQRIFMALMFVGVFVGFYYINYSANFKQVEAQSQIFVTDAVTDITTSWSPETFRKYAGESLAASSTLDGAMATYRRIGAIRVRAECEILGYEGHGFMRREKNYFTAQYECHARFASGPAQVKVTVYRYANEQTWKIQSFHVISPFFTQPVANQR